MCPGSVVRRGRRCARASRSVLFGRPAQQTALCASVVCDNVRICAQMCRKVAFVFPGSRVPIVASDSEFSSEYSRLIANAVREELARRRISRQTLAENAKIESLSTLEKALSGRRPFTLATTIRLEEALGTRLRRPDPGELTAPHASVSQAPEHLGSYARSAVSWLTGHYLDPAPLLWRPRCDLRLSHRDRMERGCFLPDLPRSRAPGRRLQPARLGVVCPTSPATSISSPPRADSTAWL